MCSGGKERKVTKENLNEYIDLIVANRLKESDNQINAIREGVNFIIPTEMLKILTWEEVEARCCGEKTISIESLKSITDYDSEGE